MYQKVYAEAIKQGCTTVEAHWIALVAMEVGDAICV